MSNLPSDTPLIRHLYGGRANSTEQAKQAAANVLEQPRLLQDLLAGLSHPVSIVRMRSAYAVSHIASERPALIQPHLSLLIEGIISPDNSHLAKACMLQTLLYLRFEEADITLMKDILLDCMYSDSSIVKTLSLEMLVAFAQKYPDMQAEVMPLFWHALDHGTPAMRARAKKLLKKYHI